MALGKDISQLSLTKLYPHLLVIILTVFNTGIGNVMASKWTVTAVAHCASQADHIINQPIAIGAYMVVIHVLVQEALKVDFLGYNDFPLDLFVIGAAVA